MKIKTLKEYMGGHRIGYVDNITPMASLGDTPPKGQGSKDNRGVGLNANSTSHGLGTMKPFLTANTEKKKAEMYKLTRKAMSIMPGSQKQKEIKIQLNKVRKELGLDPVKEELSPFKKKILQKITKPIKDYNKKKESVLYKHMINKGIIKE